MAQNVTVPDPVYEEMKRIAEEKDISIKAAFALTLEEAGHDV